ncbi:alanine:cation symporter family protein [Priestia flexa]|nr:alanine:cation symporter family protein [Priestia flexa]
MITFLLGIGILYTFRLGFIQVTMLKQAFVQTFGGMFKKNPDNKDGISPFQALATSVAAQVGTGNLAGVATAIALGGPGAIFWMWVSSFFGMYARFLQRQFLRRNIKKRKMTRLLEDLLIISEKE